jgi:peroxiredoxin
MKQRMAQIERISADLLNAYSTQTGQSLASLSTETPLLLVFLRHFGCTFCREAVVELQEKRSAIEALGTRLAFVHNGTEEKAIVFFRPHAMLDVPRVADPAAKLYLAFGLMRAEFRQYFNPESLLRAIASLLRGTGIGLPAGDVQQMPGTFLFRNGEIHKAFRNKLVSDRPDYLAMARPN